MSNHVDSCLGDLAKVWVKLSCAMLATLAPLSVLSKTDAAEPPKVQPSAERAPAPVTAQEREAWRRTLLQTPRPKKGCFAATYPETKWREVQCTKPPNRPYLPKHGISVTVGSGTDFAAQMTGNLHVLTAEGSFDSATVTNESANGNPNAYSLQLNTNFFTTTTCSTSPYPAACRGWEQFVYSSGGGGFIQYWLIQYGPGGTACPPGWNTYSPNPAEVDCWINAGDSAPAPAEPITSLIQLKVAGSAGRAVSGALDSVAVSVGDTVYLTAGDNHFPDLENQWQTAEFNVFGDGNGDQAVFDSGTTIIVRTAVNSGDASMSIPPTCQLEGWTGETNNLTLVSTPAVQPDVAWPSIIFTESNAGSATPASCATAISIGPEAVTCFVFDDGYANMEGPSEAIFISGRRGTQGSACIPGGTFGKCHRWFGRCHTVTNSVPVYFTVFDDNYTSKTGSSDAVYIPPNGNQACVPDPGPTGICRRWFGQGIAADGRKVTCSIFDDGGANLAGPFDAIYIPQPIPSPGQACIFNGVTSICHRWFGQCQATP